MNRIKLYALIVASFFNLFAADYFPLHVDNTWKYVSEPDTVTWTIVNDTIISQVKYFSLNVKYSDNDSIYKSFLFSINDFVYIVDSLGQFDTSQVFAKHAFQDGETFNISSNNEAIVSYIGNFNTEIENFDSCYLVEFSIDSLFIEDYYAPNVGFIKRVYVDYFTIEIIDYKINPNEIFYIPTSPNSGITNKHFLVHTKDFIIFNFLYEKFQSFSIFSSCGKKLKDFSKNSYNKIYIDKNMLPSGIYFLTLKKENKTYSYKFSNIK